MGNTNSISSIDLSNAYNGVASYNPVPVGVLLYLTNWAGPIWWGFAGVLLVLEKFGKQVRAKDEGEERIKYKGDDAPETTSPSAPQTLPDSKDTEPQHNHTRLDLYLVHTSILTLFASVAVASVMMACTVLRTHLFVWTVFSPKFLYMGAWTVLWHLGGNVVGGGLLFWLG